MIHHNIIERYDEMLWREGATIECRPDPGTDPCHLRWMLAELRKTMDAQKAMRWLGFIQGVMISNGMTTVTVERDFTRPYFRPTTT